MTLHQPFLTCVLFSAATLLTVSACSSETPETENATAAISNTFTLTPAQQQTFDRSCKACHGVAGTGAPGIGDAAAWAERNKQGLETLVDHTINGYGQMPPMGLCMECTQDEFVAFIAYMSGLECEDSETDDR